ncbi:hypothetical protein F5I97DRAFT_1830093 [Phlebopus sp. FC_14]|nr:hypothetical protein F5I97DRAFT_1830093 [Phlebopus sp. FC_14]
MCIYAPFESATSPTIGSLSAGLGCDLQKRALGYESRPSCVGNDNVMGMVVDKFHKSAWSLLISIVGTWTWCTDEAVDLFHPPPDPVPTTLPRATIWDCFRFAIRLKDYAYILSTRVPYRVNGTCLTHPPATDSTPRLSESPQQAPSCAIDPLGTLIGSYNMGSGPNISYHLPQLSFSSVGDVKPAGNNRLSVALAIGRDTALEAVVWWPRQRQSRRWPLQSFAATESEDKHTGSLTTPDKTAMTYPPYTTNYSKNTMQSSPVICGGAFPTGPQWAVRASAPTPTDDPWTRNLV